MVALHSKILQFLSVYRNTIFLVLKELALKAARSFYRRGLSARALAGSMLRQGLYTRALAGGMLRQAINPAQSFHIGLEETHPTRGGVQ